LTPRNDEPDFVPQRSVESREITSLDRVIELSNGDAVSLGSSESDIVLTPRNAEPNVLPEIPLPIPLQTEKRSLLYEINSSGMRVYLEATFYTYGSMEASALGHYHGLGWVGDKLCANYHIPKQRPASLARAFWKYYEDLSKLDPTQNITVETAAKPFQKSINDDPDEKVKRLVVFMKNLPAFISSMTRDRPGKKDVVKSLNSEAEWKKLLERTCGNNLWINEIPKKTAIHEPLSAKQLIAVTRLSKDDSGFVFKFMCPLTTFIEACKCSVLYGDATFKFSMAGKALMTMAINDANHRQYFVGAMTALSECGDSYKAFHEIFFSLYSELCENGWIDPITRLPWKVLVSDAFNGIRKSTTRLLGSFEDPVENVYNDWIEVSDADNNTLRIRKRFCIFHGIQIFTKNGNDLRINPAIVRKVNHIFLRTTRLFTRAQSTAYFDFSVGQILGIKKTICRSIMKPL
jgi:hypothetical protein